MLEATPIVLTRRPTRPREAPPGAFPAPILRDLVSGGDTRLDVDPGTGLNQYGVGPAPDDELISFASTTANTISSGAFNEALLTRAAIEPARTGGHATALVQPYEALTAEIARLLGIGPDVTVVPVASGTDGALYASWLAARDPGKPLHAILVGAIESGSGVPLAARGRHHAIRAPGGETVEKGASALPSPRDISVEDVPIRDPAGRPIAADVLDQAVRVAVGRAIESGARVLLHRMEGSKTGLTGPGMDLLAALGDRYGEDFRVLVDACQMRVEPARLGENLARGHAVLITGSKFIGGPPFAGALLLPRATRPLPTLPGYVDGVPRNLGLLLRWRAAVYEWRRFAAIDPTVVASRAAWFRTAVARAFASFPRARFLDDEASRAWPGTPTILPFTLSMGGAPLDLAACKKIHRALMEPAPGTRARIHIGQPVPLSGDAAALRIGLDARLIADLAVPPGETAPFDAMGRSLDLLVDRLRTILGD